MHRRGRGRCHVPLWPVMSLRPEHLTLLIQLLRRAIPFISPAQLVILIGTTQGPPMPIILWPRWDILVFMKEIRLVFVMTMNMQNG